MVIECFFLTATDARFAIRDFKREGLEVSPPKPSRPNNGRSWQVDVEPKVGMTDRYPQQHIFVLAYRIATRHNGITEQVDRFA